MVNLGKTKVMIFTKSKKSVDHHFFFRGEEIKIISAYTYLGVQFLGPHYSLRPTLQPRIAKGYGSLALLERQCFHHHFQDISSKMSLMDSLIRPTFLYVSKIWGPSLLELDWDSIEGVHSLLLRHIIRSKKIVPHHTILADFGARPFPLETVFRLVSFLHLI